MSNEEIIYFYNVFPDTLNNFLIFLGSLLIKIKLCTYLFSFSWNDSNQQDMDYSTCISQLILNLLLAFVTANGCRSVTSVSNYILYNHTYKIIPSIDLVTCISICDNGPNCYSINYVFPMRLCELSDATRAVDPIAFQFFPDAVYIEHLFRPEGSCTGDFPCKNRGTCVNIPQYPGYRCFCTDAYIGDQCEGMFGPISRLSLHLYKNCTYWLFARDR